MVITFDEETMAKLHGATLESSDTIDRRRVRSLWRKQLLVSLLLSSLISLDNMFLVDLCSAESRVGRCP